LPNTSHCIQKSFVQFTYAAIVHFFQILKLHTNCLGTSRSKTVHLFMFHCQTEVTVTITNRTK